MLLCNYELKLIRSDSLLNHSNIMGKKSHKKTKKDKKDKKPTGRQREQRRKIMKLAKLFKESGSSSSSSSTSGSDEDPRQNSQIKRNLRRKALKMAAEALNDQLGLGLHSSSSTDSTGNDTWATKAATLANALGTVLACNPPNAGPKATAPPPSAPPTATASQVHSAGINQAASIQPAAGFPFPPTPPGIPLHNPGFIPQLFPTPGSTPGTGTPFPFPPPPPFNAVHVASNQASDATGLHAKQLPGTVPPKAATVDVPPAEPKHSNSALQMAELFDAWNLDTRKCNSCQQYTYYRNGICINKQCSLNRCINSAKSNFECLLHFVCTLCVII